MSKMSGEEAMFSLGKAARLLGTSKSTVHRWCMQLGIKTGGGITAADIKKLHEKLRVRVAVKAEEDLEEDGDDLEEDGDDGVTSAADSGVNGDVALPVSFDPSAAIACFLGEDGVGKGEDEDKTSEILEIAGTAIEALNGAMGSIVQKQRERLMKTERDALSLQVMLGELAVNMKVSALEARILEAMSDSNSRKAEHLVSKLLSMGKSKNQDGDMPPS